MQKIWQTILLEMVNGLLITRLKFYAQHKDF